MPRSPVTALAHSLTAPTADAATFTDLLHFLCGPDAHRLGLTADQQLAAAHVHAACLELAIDAAAARLTGDTITSEEKNAEAARITRSVLRRVSGPAGERQYEILSAWQTARAHT